MSASQITYAMQASSYAIITPCDEPQVVYKAMLLKCNYDTSTDTLYIGLNVSHSSIFPHKLSVDVKFEVDHSYFYNLNDIIFKISDEALRRIIPIREDFDEGFQLRPIPKTKFPQLKLDKDQFHGLQTMLFSQSSAPVLIPGPFGSGKTHLLAVAAQEIVHYSKEKKRQSCSHLLLSERFSRHLHE